ncbi:hypothetical protein [Immundisolibacter sp.]|uniref:hypothetical protein n=1 Tax=Immundisolibacter sp. TaxID=1934948 RepID=UPI0026142817|nr:hypothetical protein [Immundisolibacter sp.]MDD3649889.1 hypothetical protein [Immundisolibacter sp.]
MPNSMPEFKLEASDLYVEEVFTDRRVGSIRRLQPVTVDGQPDPGRPVQFIGQTQILTPMGALPLTFEIPAATLAEAVEQFPAQAQQALEETARELQELRREQASSIVVPEPGMAAGLTGGGRPGGGRIQLR